jgi:hypothetical protein
LDSPSLRRQSPELLHVSPSWATQGLCIDGFSSTAEKRIVSGESLGDIANSPLVSFLSKPDYTRLNVAPGFFYRS